MDPANVQQKKSQKIKKNHAPMSNFAEKLCLIFMERYPVNHPRWAEDDVRGTLAVARLTMRELAR